MINGQWLKSIRFKLPIIEKDFGISLDNDTHVETVCLLSNRKPDTKVRIDVDLEDYYRIKDAKKRSVKVYGQSGCKYRETPTIMLKGLWLKEAGFDIGDYISVTCEDGKIITQGTERAVL